MKTITIPAAINGVDGVYNENFGQPGFAIVSASSSFFLQIGNGQAFKVSVGGQIGSDSGPELGRITFSNKTTTAIDVTIGDYNSKIATIPPDLQNVVGITSITNPFTYQIWDTTKGDPSPFIFSLRLPANKPYRRIWAYFDASVFPWPSGADVVSGVALNFTLSGTLMLALPARYNVYVSPSQFGVAMGPTPDGGNRAARHSTIFYQNSDGSGKVYELFPFDVYVNADAITFAQVGQDVGDQVSGNMRAYLAVLSSEVPII